jgi:hypothetical protein
MLNAKQEGSMDLMDELRAIVKSQEQGQTLEQIADQLAVRILPEIKITLDELSDGGVIRKDLGVSIYETTYHRSC